MGKYVKNSTSVTVKETVNEHVFTFSDEEVAVLWTILKNTGQNVLASSVVDTVKQASSNVRNLNYCLVGETGAKIYYIRVDKNV